MTDTPETDAAAFVAKKWMLDYDVVTANFCRTLERRCDTYEKALVSILEIAYADKGDIRIAIQSIQGVLVNTLIHQYHKEARTLKHECN